MRQFFSYHLSRKAEGNGPLKPWQPILVFIKTRCQFHPPAGGEISQIHSSKYLRKILKAHLIYRVSFFLYPYPHCGEYYKAHPVIILFYFLVVIAAIYLQSHSITFFRKMKVNNMRNATGYWPKFQVASRGY